MNSVPRCELSEAETALVEWLVRQHLLMSMTAQKQDIADPEVIHRFATLVADRERLDNLYLLTCADIAGTSPEVVECMEGPAAGRSLHRDPIGVAARPGAPAAPPTNACAETQDAARATLTTFGVSNGRWMRCLHVCRKTAFERSRPDQIVWQAASLRDVDVGEGCVRARPVSGSEGALEVFVHSRDRDGLFAAIVATLDRLGLAIQQARVLDGPHEMVFDSFEVVPADARQTPSAEEVEERLAQALAGSLEGIKPTRRTQPRHLRHFRIPAQVGFDDISVRGAIGGSVHRTMLSLVCTDRPGLLADVARYCASRSCACTMPESLPSANVPRTYSRSPTSATSRWTIRNSRR